MSEKHDSALKATEDAIKEAKKAVESRKNLHSEMQNAVNDKLAEEFKSKLAEAESALKQKDNQI